MKKSVRCCRVWAVRVSHRILNGLFVTLFLTPQMGNLLLYLERKQ
ncbi:hypothetical protein NC651_027110 [Populus alba x Populus x berolinensis]|nr:hypothetical protein NC651_027110 [Populus alba x Populus x berolinensis]